MELQVYKNTTVREIKERFCRYFPFLKLEFFMYHHATADDTPVNKDFFNGIYLKKSSEFFIEGSICFNPSTTVAELEQEFQIELGVAAKLLRTADDGWVDTSQTSHLSLGKQNSMGAGLARSMRSNAYTLFL